MEIENKRPNIRKTLIIASGVVVVLGAIALGTQWWIANRAMKMIQNETAQLTKGLNVKIGDIRVSLLSRSIMITGISIKADSTAFNTQDSSFRTLDLKIDQLAVKGVGLKKKHGNTSLHVRVLEVITPIL